MSRSTITVIPTKSKRVEVPDFAGDYVLKRVVLINHVGKKVDVKFLIQELNVYESIYKNAVTGTLVIADDGNQIARMSIQGLEKIAFLLKTPGVTTGKEDVVDASEETGEPFHVYKVSDRKQASPGLMTYTLHFASREFMRNIRTKVSQSYDDRYDLIVRDILSDKSYLDSRKKLHYENTGNRNKIVIPNLTPFDAINMIAKKSISDKTKGVGYYFYETTGGYYFRSWQNMIMNQGRFARKPKQTFYYQPQKMGSDSKTTNQTKIERAYQSVEAYEFTNNFHDIATNTLLGTYGHRVISHNLFDKSYDVSDYNFHNQIEKTPHTDRGDHFPIADTPVDYDNWRKVSDYKESRVSLQTTSPFLHDKSVGKYGLEPLQDGDNTGKLASQGNQVVLGTALKLTVKGQSNLQAGDMIEFNLRSVDSGNSQSNPPDPRFSGNYIITKVRHQVADSQYRMVLECAKDSVATKYGGLSRGQSMHGEMNRTSRTYQEEELDSHITGSQGSS